MPDEATCPSLFLLTSPCILIQTLRSVWPICHQHSLWPYGDFPIPLCWLFQLVFASQISACSLSLKQAMQHSLLLGDRERERERENMSALGLFPISSISTTHLVYFYNVRMFFSLFIIYLFTQTKH